MTESANVFRSSGISRKSGTLIVRYSQKKELISFVFYCSENPSNAHNIVKPLVRSGGVLSKNYVALQISTSTKYKLKISHVRFQIPRSHHNSVFPLYRDLGKDHTVVL